MAVKRGSSGGGSGDSKQGLIITVVVLSLLSVILAVTTYIGFYNGDEKLKKDLKTAQDDVKNYDQDADWYKFQALSYRSYMGLDLSPKEKESLDTLRGKFDSGALKTRDLEAANVTKVIKEQLDDPTLKTELGKDGKIVVSYGWDTSNKQPLKTAKGQLEKELVKNVGQGKNFANEQAKTADLTKQLADEKAGLKKAKDDHANALKALTAEWEEKYQAKSKELEGLQIALKNKGDENAQLRAENEVDKKKHAAEIVKKDKEIKLLQQDILRKTEEAKNQQLATNVAEAKFVRLENDRPRGEVSLITGTGQTPFINLGSADKVRTGLRFTVHGVDNNGKPKLEAKATLEIIDIVKDHLSQARLIKVVDPGADPVLTGDKLFNPAWAPNRKKHVAIAGVVDLSGAHKDGLAEFMRELKRQDIEVDAYLDLKEATTKGEITRNTDFLILGEQPEDSSLHLSKDKMAQIAKETDAMTKAAARNAVPLVSLREFLAVTGYPQTKSGDTTNYNLHPNLSTGSSTSDRFKTPK